MGLPPEVLLQLVRGRELLATELAETHLALDADRHCVHFGISVEFKVAQVAALVSTHAAPEWSPLTRGRLVVCLHNKYRNIMETNKFVYCG